MEFCNLYIQTEYSMLKSSVKLDKLLDKATSYKYLGISDVNCMHGVIKFYKGCLEKNIKPIIGLTLKLRGPFNDDTFLLYAKNNNGYKNLLKISTIVNIKSDLVIDDFKDYLNDLIVILPGIENEMIRSLIHKKDIKVTLDKYLNLFEELYIGLDLLSYEMKENIDFLINYFKDFNCIALDKTLFLEKDDYEVYEVLRMVELNAKSYTPTEKEVNSYFKSNDFLYDCFRNYKTLINNSLEVARKCCVSIEFNKFHMPVYDYSIDSNKYIYDLSIKGLKKRLEQDLVDKALHKKYLDRLLYELNIVIQMGFSDYFLIVYDFIKYSKKNKILVGPGRGTAASALLSYSLGITEVDPLKYDLLFERFLNPERISMPDIDTDFPDELRDDVINYLGKKYSKERVCRISTFGTYGPRMAIRDVCRVRNIDDIYLNEILKYVDNSSVSIEDVIKNDENFRRMVLENEIIKTIVKLVIKMENLPRNLSIHAAGIIMADAPLVNYTPLLGGVDGLYQTQFEASDLESLGLVKIDILGLKYLSIIDKIQKQIKDFDVSKIKLDDSKTYDLIRSGETNGIFQLESSGMKKTLGLLKTSSFNDIVNALALYRPGPMEMIPSFCNRKFGKEKIDYYHKDLKKILESTYGVIVYQEQILQIANVFSGYSLGEADILRRAVSKKQESLIEKERTKFIQGAIKNGHDESVAIDIFELIKRFANYGFNKSHSVSYSIISYRMSYLKRHYLKEFMAVKLSYTDKDISLKHCINECSRYNIKVNIPSINISCKDFIIYNNEIYYSLLRINGIGESIVYNIIKERSNGLFKSFEDFITRTKEILNKKVIEMLIYSGAFDEFNKSRKSLILDYENNIKVLNYGLIFDGEIKERNDDLEFSFDEISSLERLALGFNLKYDVFIRYRNLVKDYKTTKLGFLKVGYFYRCLFVLESLKEITSKSNTLMAFVKLQDDTKEVEGVIFSEAYNKLKNRLAVGKVYIAEVKTSFRNDNLQIIINNIIFEN